MLPRARTALLLLSLLSRFPAAGQTPVATPAPAEAAGEKTVATPTPKPAPSPTPPPAAIDSHMLLEQIGGCVESGRLNVEIDLLDGQYPATPAWTIETTGSPQAAMTTEAAGGKVRRLEAALSKGRLLIAGRGLRPKVYVDSFAFAEGQGVTAAKFQGKGIWRPIVAIFRGLATSALKKLELKTDIPSVLRGEIFGSRPTAVPSEKESPATPRPAATPPPAPGGPSFMDLVREVRVKDSSLVAFGGKPIGLGETVQFQTAAGDKADFPLRVTVDRGLYQPSHGGAPTRIDVEGRIDGEIENGSVVFGENRSTFSHGQLRGGHYHVQSDESGAYRTEIAASAFSVDLTSGEFRVPGGPAVSVDPPSRIGIRDLRLRLDGSYSGLLDADLQGKVGRIARSGSVVSASDIRVRTQGLDVVGGRANGDVDLQFLYRVEYPLIVHYPVEQLGTRSVPLLFQGPFTTHLHLENAGKDEGSVTGEYAFQVPWPPVEQAAVELLRARWSQDIKAIIRKVDFDIEPRRFGPCGGTCFLLQLGVTAEKKNTAGKSLFRQICEPEGRADLLVDPASRSFQLRNIKLQTRCKGVVGWVINFVSPLLTKTYTDMTVFQMPSSLPFTVESVGSGADYVSIAGRVVWEAGTQGPAAVTPPAP